jgi:hypothetical protein
MADFLRGQDQDCESWELAALTALTWRDDVAYTPETLAQLRSALATVRRSVPEHDSHAR